MIAKKVTQVGNSVIRTKAKKVGNPGSKEIKKLVKDLTDSMRHHELVGMAAPQIGVGLRVFVTEVRPTKLRKSEELDELRVFINPTLTHVSNKKVSGLEGCGSVAHAKLLGRVKRADAVTITAVDETGQSFTLTAKGLLARVIQHEYDHLEGKIFVDKMADMKSLVSAEEVSNV